MKMAFLRIPNGVYILLPLIISAGCSSTPSLIETTVRIDSHPQDALVMLCSGGDFEKSKAIILGKTPLVRHSGVAEAGSTVRITKAGYHPWNGTITPEKSKLSITLRSYTEEEKEQLGVSSSMVFNRIRVMPLRVGIRRATTSSSDLETSSDCNEFSARFIETFYKNLKKRFGDQILMRENAQLAKSEYWEELEKNLKNVDVETLEYYPVPPRAQLSRKFESVLAEIEGGVLLVRAEAYYLSEEDRSSQVAASILLTAASTTVGLNKPVGGGSSQMSVIPIFGPPMSQDIILAQLFLLNGTTKEMLWFGQVVVNNYFKRASVVEQVAKQAAMQVPSSFIVDSKRLGSNSVD